MGVRLPPEYQETEYLESTGSQYIDSLVYSEDALSYKIIFQYTKEQTNPSTVFGCYKTKNSKIARTQFNYVNDGVLGWGNAFERYSGNVDTALHIAEISRDGFWLDGQLIYTPTSHDFSVAARLFLFCVNGNDEPLSLADGLRIHSFQVFRGQNMVRNFIPSYRKYDFKPGMYELLSGLFFINAGTGEFLVGPDVVSIGDTSPWLMERRRLLMQNIPVELYPVGTHVLSMYIGDKDGGLRRKFVSGHGINTSNGEYIVESGSYASPVFVPVNPKYTYQKNGMRLITWAYYDKNKNFLQAGPSYNNLSVQTLRAFPEKVRFVRIEAFNYADQAIEITRIS